MRRLVAALAVVGLAVGVATVAQSQTEPVVEHVSVRAGEGLWTVAARLCPGNVGVQYTALQQANPWYTVGLHPGTVLHVPERSCPPATTTSTTSTTTVPASGFPTPETTGPRFAAETVTTGGLSTSADGQVIERVEVNGRLTIRHDNVTVRDVTVMGTGSYMIYVRPKEDGTCPIGVLVEHTEIDGSNAPADAMAMYGDRCGYTFDHGLIHNVGRGPTIKRDVTISNSYIYTDRTWDGAHRNAVLSGGGSNLTVTGNALFCEGTGCSSALSLYGDFGPIDNALIQGNLMSTTGHYCVYGGSAPSKPYQGSNVRVISNHWSTALGANCGRTAPLTALAAGQRGNMRCGNIWAETGEPADVNC